jgi:DNA repair protein RadC
LKCFISVVKANDRDFDGPRIPLAGSLLERPSNQKAADLTLFLLESRMRENRSYGLRKGERPKKHLDQLYIEPREVFMAAMMNNAKAIIAFHNHPSGNPEPSRDDIFLTRRLKEAGRIMSIELLDHLIIGERNYVSLKEKGLM